MATTKTKIEIYINDFMARTKTEIEEYVNSLIATIKDTADLAIAKATALVNVMKQAAIQLKADAIGIYNAAKVFRKVILDERNIIFNAVYWFTTKLKDAAIVVKDNAVAVATQMSEAVSEIQVPMNRVKDKIDLLYQDRYNLAAAIVNAWYALGHLTYMNYGGQQAVIEEVMEAFTQIGGAFSNLGTAFKNLGSEVATEGEKLRNAINGAMVRIADAMRVFVKSFQALGNNLANVLDTA